MVYTAADPKRRYVTGKDRNDVRQKLTKAITDRDGGLVFDAGTLTAKEYLERWLKDSVQGTVSQSTYDVYGYMVHPGRAVRQAHAHALGRQGGGRGAPKTPSSRRSVGREAHAVEALRAHLARQLAEMEEMGSLYRPGGLVFANEVGGIIIPSNLRNQHLARLLQRAELPKIRFHDLRHTYATLLLTKNVDPKIVTEMLGHSSISVTLDTYSHVLPSMRENAVRALEEAMR